MKNTQIIILLLLMAAVAVVLIFFFNKKVQDKKKEASPTRPAITQTATTAPNYTASTPIIDRNTADIVAKIMADMGLKNIVVSQAYKTA